MENGELDPEVKEAIFGMSKQIQELNEIALAGIKPRLDDVIRNRITDSKTIERLLDELLDCAGMSEEGLALFKRLCRYYFRIDPAATAEYIYIYRDLYDSDNDDEEQKDTTATLLTSAPAAVVSTKSPFTDTEIQTMCQSQASPWVDSVLFLLYTGFRISEMLDLRTENVNLENGTMKGGTKTKAGKDRVVPIHPKIRHIVERRLQDDSEYLFAYNGNKCKETTYRAFWREIMDTADMQHTPHECRHTFRSRLDSAGANKRCIDLMMGHQTGDIGERIYTHKTFDELKTAIELLS